MIDAVESSSTRPYLIRAIYEWCTDNGFTPYIAVLVDESVQVPREYVKNGEIVLNVSFDATSSLKLGNDFIEFKARFAGVAREIMVPIGRVVAIYARETGHGITFPAPVPGMADGVAPAVSPVRPAPRAPEGADARVVHLVASEEGSDTPASVAESAPENPDDPPRPPSGGGARPSLKRIK